MGVIRRIKKLIISRNPDNTVINLGGSDEIHIDSDQDGALESIYCEQILNHHCGCFAPPGGRCSECGVISCINCHCHCGGDANLTSLGCGKPLCREHSHYIILADGQSLPFCQNCYSKIVRQNRRKKIQKALLSPFVQSEDCDD